MVSWLVCSFGDRGGRVSGTISAGLRRNRRRPVSTPLSPRYNWKHLSAISNALARVRSTIHRTIEWTITHRPSSSRSGLLSSGASPAHRPTFPTPTRLLTTSTDAPTALERALDSVKMSSVELAELSDEGQRLQAELNEWADSLPSYELRRSEQVRPPTTR